MVEINDVIYEIELDNTSVTPSPIDLTMLFIRCVTSLGNLSICVSEKLIKRSVSFCRAGVCLIKLLIFEITIGAIKATTIAIIAINTTNIVKILAHLGNPHFSNNV